MKDLYNSITLVQSIAPVVGANSSAPAAVEIDLAGFNSCVLAWLVGAEGSTLSDSNYWTMTLEHADDSATPGTAGTYAAVAAADVQGATPATGVVFTVDDPAKDNAVYKIGYIGGKRHLKVTIAETGTGPNLPQALLVIKGNPLDAPVA